MRFLHTADWHLGKNLRNRSRLDEQEQALREVLDIASREKIDCLLMAGDLFDSHAPSAEAERMAYGFFAELSAQRIPAVFIAGNHDHPGRLGALEPLLGRMQIHVRPHIRPPADGGVIEIEVKNERARIAVVPWVPEHKLINAELMMGAQADRAVAYAERMSLMMESLCEAFTADTVNLLMGHVYVMGALASGTERAVHLSRPYALTAQRFPAFASYVALGHLHRPQQIDAPCPALYSGSLLQLDFGEEGQQKRVVIVDATAGKKARMESIPLSSGRTLRTVKAPMAEIEKRAAGLSNGDLLRVIVPFDKPQPGVSQKIRQLLPDAIDVQIEVPRPSEEKEESAPARLPAPEELFERYYRSERECETPPELLKAFRKLYQEALDAPR
jgi:exonuclease SbcD